LKFLKIFDMEKFVNIFVVLIVIAIEYCIGSFIAADFNCMHWMVIGRIIMAIAFLLTLKGANEAFNENF